MPARVLDVGCGSGILGIAALALGAADGRRARHRSAGRAAATVPTPSVNGFADRLTVRQGTLRRRQPAEPYPLVLANLVAAVLIELAPRLAAHLALAGRCWPAGSSTTRADEVEAGARRPPACIGAERRVDGEWVSLRIGARVTLHRFFVAPDAMRRRALPAAGRRSRTRCSRVLRLQDGERLVLLDGAGEAATVRLAGGACVVESRSPAGGEPVHRLVIWQALLRGDHLEPVDPPWHRDRRRGVPAVRVGAVRGPGDLAAAPGAAAGRGPRGGGAVGAGHGAAGRGAGAASRRARAGSVLLYERADGARLGSLIPPASLVIGPEGGFTPDEVAAAERAGRDGRRPGAADPALGVGGAGRRAAVVLSRSGDFA